MGKVTMPDELKEKIEQRREEQAKKDAWILKCAVVFIERCQFAMKDAIEYAGVCYDSCDPEIDDPKEFANEEIHALSN